MLSFRVSYVRQVSFRNSQCHNSEPPRKCKLDTNKRNRHGAWSAVSRTWVPRQQPRVVPPCRAPLGTTPRYPVCRLSRSLLATSNWALPCTRPSSTHRPVVLSVYSLPFCSCWRVQTTRALLSSSVPPRAVQSAVFVENTSHLWITLSLTTGVIISRALSNYWPLIRVGEDALALCQLVTSNCLPVMRQNN